MSAKTETVRLDFKTWLYLFLSKIVTVEHIPVEPKEEKLTMNIQDSQPNEVYIFKNYKEYRNFFLMYLNEVDDYMIDWAIITRGSKGQIVALKGLCEFYIVNKKIKEFHSSITPEQVAQIHAKGKLTPGEAVELWESLNLCMDGSRPTLDKDRCKYFYYNCHDCLMEMASHQLEHSKIDYSKSDPSSAKGTTRTRGL